MRIHPVKVQLSRSLLTLEEQLAWKMAGVAVDPVAVEKEVTDMIVNRVIDNAGVAMAAINRHSVVTARDMAKAHPRARGGATIFGLSSDQRYSPEWSAWANNTAVRELDMHDTFLAADYSHPGDNIPPLLAVAQATNKTGKDLIRGIATAYEIHINLVRGMCLHEYRVDHIAHLCPAIAAGVGTMLRLPQDVIYQAIQQAVHVSITFRQSRKGTISSWKAYAPAHAGKLAVEAVDRAMRGETAPSPIYEGEDSVIAWVLSGRSQSEKHGRVTVDQPVYYEVPLPEEGEPKRAILESYTKEHSAEYQAQALIDLAFRMRQRIVDTESIDRVIIHTSHHTHYVIGTGSNDPQKMDPMATRETLDHSIMYIFTVALQDGRLHHIDSYTQERASRPDTVRLWRKVETREDPLWTQRYHAAVPGFGGRVEVVLKDGTRVVEELDVANAHPNGHSPFGRGGYVGKFLALTKDIVVEEEADRFLTNVQQLEDMPSTQLHGLNVSVPQGRLLAGNKPGIF